MSQQPRGSWRQAGSPLVICVLAWIALGVGPIEVGELIGPTREPAPKPEPRVAQLPVDRAERGPSRTYTDSARQLLGGLSVGEEVGDWKVASIDGERDDGSIHIAFVSGSKGFEAVVVPRGSWPHGPPKRTSSYDFFYTGLAAGTATTPVLKVLEQLATRVGP